MRLSAASIRAFKDAIRICHPDLVAEAHIDKATEFTKALNAAKADGDDRRITQIAAAVKAWEPSKKPPLRKSTPRRGESHKTQFGLEIVRVSPGSFTMGSRDNVGLFPHGPEAPRVVNITKPFWMGRTPVTQRQFNKVMGRKCPQGRGSFNNHPVTNVTWEEANDFCRRATEQTADLDGFSYSLPTEAQWEYACRAGTTTVFAGEHLEEMGWFSGNSDGKTNCVAKKKPNPWGLYDMHGNVSEWCRDEYRKINEVGPLDDPFGLPWSNHKIFRGGSWKSHPDGCRSYYRWWGPPVYKEGDLGFRIIAVPGH